MKYLILQCHDKFAVALAEDGRFLKVKNQNFIEGQRVAQVVLYTAPAARALRVLAPLAAVAACLLIVATALLNPTVTAHASVYLTINPEVRVDVDQADCIIAAEGINADGRTLLTDVQLKGLPLSQGMDVLVDKAIELGYLSEGGKVTLTLDGEQTWVTDHAEQLNTQITNHLAERLTITIDLEQILHEGNSHTTTPITLPDSPYGESAYADTDYGPHADGQTDYDPDEDGITDYPVSLPEPPTTDGQTDYAARPEPPVETPPVETPPAANEQIPAVNEQTPSGRTDYDAEDGNSDYEDDSAYHASDYDNDTDYQ